MGKIQVLDCTLRDGGYINNWLFGEKYINRIIAGLRDSHIDIIECGYLSDDGVTSGESTKVRQVEQFKEHIPQNSLSEKMSYVCMMNYGDYCVKNLRDRVENGIGGIRVAFHKKDMTKALQVCRDIQDKGYDVYVQPMVTLSYSDGEILELISMVNDICPKAFYIVDSYGSMRQKDLLRLFYLVAHNLNENTIVGYHSHNNLQLAYSNAQALVEVSGNRELIIDTSVFGMGRGAGNLNTELFIDFLNNFANNQYEVAPLLKVMDNVLSQIYMMTPWGYSLPYYLSAVHNCHPKYASYLAKKNTLAVEDMNAIFGMMIEAKKYEFDDVYMEALYEKYMNKGVTGEENIEIIKREIGNRSVLLIAPGKSVKKNKTEIQNFQKYSQIITISVNSDFVDFKTDYIFVSNIRRFEELDCASYRKTIVTSNIQCEDVLTKVDYVKLENADKVIKDNAGIMALSLLKMLGVQKVYLAGFDGYSTDIHENYADRKLYLTTDEKHLSDMNGGMKKAINQMKECMDIVFLTESRLNSGDKNEGK